MVACAWLAQLYLLKVQLNNLPDDLDNCLLKLTNEIEGDARYSGQVLAVVC